MPASLHVVDRPVKNDVKAARWLGYAGAKAHAFLVPSGPLESPTGDGQVKSVCTRAFTIARLAGDGHRCKLCVKAMTEAEVKHGTGLSERTVDVVDTGAQHGDPRDAERRRASEVALISGDAPERNATIGEQLSLGDKVGARKTARALDERGPAAPVPAARMAPLGSRDHGRSDGVAMVRGAAMKAVQPQRGWKATAGTMAGPIGRERADKEASTVPMHGGTYGYLTKADYEQLSRTQQRKYWVKLRRMEQRAENLRTAARAKITADQQTAAEITRLHKVGAEV